MTKKADVWHILSWKDEAGRDDSMVGPLSALKAKVKELKAAGTEHDLSEFVFEVAAQDTASLRAKEVAGKDMEVRND